MTRYEWHKAPDFAEVAEVLGIPTDCVMAMRPGQEQVLVLWTASDDRDLPPEQVTVKAVAMKRDGDGILRLVDLPRDAGLLSDFFPPRPS
jgi:hypothetical protein